MDGNWKLTFPHCMFPVKAGLPGLPALNMCIEQLLPRSAFCAHHYEVATSKGYPTTIRGFLKFCGVSQTQCTYNYD